MNIAFLGAGGWGTALASVLAQNEHSVSLWTFEEDVVSSINERNLNETYLASEPLNPTITASSDPQVVNNADIVVVATPTQFIRETLANYSFDLADKKVVSVSKGIEIDTEMRVSEILRDVSRIRSRNFCVLTGPSHAEEVVRSMPTTVLSASRSIDFAHEVQQLFATPYFRVYHSSDVIGAELGGALKNVIAISAGILDGLGMGDNTKAALITRGLAEMARLGEEMGANPATFSGLSGMGDLIVTCNSRHSRNRSVGERIGRGETLEQIRKDQRKVAEGVSTTLSAKKLADHYKVEMPIVDAVHQVLFEGLSPSEATNLLFTRPAKAEKW